MGPGCRTAGWVAEGLSHCESWSLQRMCSWKVVGGQGGPTGSTASGMSSVALWPWWGHACPFWVPEHLFFYTLWERHAQHPFSRESWGHRAGPADMSPAKSTLVMPGCADSSTEGKLSYTVTKMQSLDGNQVISS